MKTINKLELTNLSGGSCLSASFLAVVGTAGAVAAVVWAPPVGWAMVVGGITGISLGGAYADVYDQCH